MITYWPGEIEPSHTLSQSEKPFGTAKLDFQNTFDTAKVGDIKVCVRPFFHIRTENTNSYKTEKKGITFSFLYARMGTRAPSEAVHSVL